MSKFKHGEVKGKVALGWCWERPKGYYTILLEVSGSSFPEAEGLSSWE